MGEFITHRTRGKVLLKLCFELDKTSVGQR